MEEIVEVLKNSDIPEVISLGLKFRIAEEIIALFLVIPLSIWFFKNFFKK